MAFLSALNISASGMTAERMRLDVVSENISNLKTAINHQKKLFSENSRKELIFFPEYANIYVFNV